MPHRKVFAPCPKCHTPRFVRNQTERITAVCAACDRRRKIATLYPRGVQYVSYTRPYKIWGNILSRCYNPKTPKFHRYGGRGITVCEAWRESSRAFVRWALANGYRDDLEIDRIDNDGPYTPQNCRWVTHHENCQNRSFYPKNRKSRAI